MLKRAEKIDRQLTLAKQRLKSVDDEVLKFDNQDEQEIKLIDYLLKFYLSLTPRILDQQYQLTLERYEAQSPEIEAQASKLNRLLSKMSYQLISVDEFVNFKKYFVTALGNDRDRIQGFFDANPGFKRLAEFIFRCRRIKFSADATSEQIRLIYNF